MEEITQNLFNVLFDESSIYIKSFEVLDRLTLNDKNEWVEDTPSYFVGIGFDGVTPINVSELLSTVSGLEYNIFLY